MKNLALITKTTVIKNAPNYEGSTTQMFISKITTWRFLGIPFFKETISVE